MGPSPVRPAPRLEVRDLRLVLAVAREGSLTQAGEVLHVSQPALSRHLRQLETRVGAELFVRTGTRMEPTAAGALLLRHAAAVLEQLEAAEVALQSSGTGGRRVLRVGTECYTGYHWLPAVSNRFGTAHPGVEIQIAFDAAGDPLPLLREGTIDVALLTAPRTVRGIALLKLFNDELVAAVSPRHPWATRPYVAAKDFADVRLLLLSSPETSYVVNRFLTPAGIEPRHVADVQLVGAMAALIEADFGVGALPSWTIATEVKAGRLVPLRLGRHGVFRTWLAAVRRAERRDPSIQDFVAALSTGVPAAGFRATR
ncbi:MAG TPA: LysR family transcriptional regulator [Gemmatimonadaceae bacterium]